mmetsp:Transcript_35324/g.80861  ORF Transcript_35324/g.80861 Transcript_35324/m.80861 type:complete len:128 (-) Transcript_35324:757-1140(-)
MRTTQQYGGGSGHRSNRTERQLTRVRRVASVGGLGYCLDQRLMRDVAFGDFDCWSSLAQQWKPSDQFNGNHPTNSDYSSTLESAVSWQAAQARRSQHHCRAWKSSYRQLHLGRQDLMQVRVPYFGQL